MCKHPPYMMETAHGFTLFLLLGLTTATVTSIASPSSSSSSSSSPPSPPTPWAPPIHLPWMNTTDVDGRWLAPYLWWYDNPVPLYPDFEKEVIVYADPRRPDKDDTDVSQLRPATPYPRLDNAIDCLQGSGMLFYDPTQRLGLTIDDLKIATAWTISTSKSHSYPRRSGSLGLGQQAFKIGVAPSQPLNALAPSSPYLSSFSMHVGSSVLGSNGSFIFNGYDQKRVVGEAAVFNITPRAPKPQALLVDIVLGVEMGGSPFDPSLKISDGPKSVWRSGTPHVSDVDAPSGTKLADLTANTAFITLSDDNCDTIAQHLPVEWRSDIQFYVWKTSSPRYTDLIASPAYLGFVLNDGTKDTTIKVPFPLLNQVLDAPIVSQQTPYFPCKSGDRTILGRAFLQSAMLAVDYTQNKTYVAQGPGPNVVGDSTFNLPAPGKKLETDSSSSFVKSWSGHWSPLPLDFVAPTEDDGRPGSLAAGAIAGIVVGVIAAVAMACAAAFAVWRHKRKARASEELESQGSESASTVQEADSVSLKKIDEKTEIDAEEAAKHELEGSEQRHETDGQQIAELEG
ncbi:hypothetical protein VHEMI08935 [[Torrubiella] hemipterigena]|uniref:Peptidase A1 domain-containing protein n=1 Tax=[Torrubiella] hemipterigena TaxID=1531966 RepID=A0A0A1TQL2_9HYPO|nr:hypothetical protein VHEMI08935 [[Torrubiella] hemipterigena]